MVLSDVFRPVVVSVLASLRFMLRPFQEFPSGVRDEERVRPAFLQAAADISGVFEFLDFFEDCVRLIAEFFRVGNLLNRFRRRWQR